MTTADHQTASASVYARRVPESTVLYEVVREELETLRVTHRIVRRLRALLIRRGLAPDADIGDADPLALDEPLLAEIYAASVRGRTAMGERAGRRPLRVCELVDPEETASVDSPRCTSIDGVSLHANVSVPARDRRRLEKLCRYLARPPVATERLSRLDDGRLLYRLKRRWRDGTTHIIFERLELVEKLAAIVPPPRFHMIRYHGVFSPRAARRRDAVNDRVHASKPERSSWHGTARAADRSAATNRPGRDGANPGHRCVADERRERSNPPRCTLPWIPWAELMPSVRGRRSSMPCLWQRDASCRRRSPARRYSRDSRVDGTVRACSAPGAVTTGARRQHRDGLKARDAGGRDNAAPDETCRPTDGCCADDYRDSIVEHRTGVGASTAL